ncbi:hypothetical protein RB596_008292 [Gaeumannomyces avenae]
MTCQYKRSSAVGFGRPGTWSRPPSRRGLTSVSAGPAASCPMAGGTAARSGATAGWTSRWSWPPSAAPTAATCTAPSRTATYAWLNQTQCSVTSEPTAFAVAADMTVHTIRVSPLSPAAAPLDMDPTRALVNNSFHAVSYMSQTLSTLYTSVIGDNLRFNALNIARRRRQQEDTSDGSSGGRRVGEPAFVYPLAALAALLLAVFACEVVRLALFAESPGGGAAAPGMDCLDLKSAVLAMAKGSLVVTMDGEVGALQLARGESQGHRDAGRGGHSDCGSSGFTSSAPMEDAPLQGLAPVGHH